MTGPLAPSRHGRHGALRPASVLELPPLRAVHLLEQLSERLRMVHDGLRPEEADLHGVRARLRVQGAGTWRR